MIVANFKDGYLGQGRCMYCKWARWEIKPLTGLYCTHPKLKPNNQSARKCTDIRLALKKQNPCGPGAKLWEKMY